jgi:radical SAM family protein
MSRTTQAVRRGTRRIHLVNPSHVSFGIGVITPRWLYVLAGATPDTFGTPILTDETLEPIEAAAIQPGDIVGIGIHSGNALRGYEVGVMARRAGASVIFGGIHATLYPDEARDLGGAHAVVKGDGECAWPTALNDCARGSLQPVYEGGRVEPDQFSPARWDLLPPGRYMWGSVQTVRGCPKHCSFCSVWRTDGQRPRQRGSSSVVDEIVDLRRRGFRFIALADDNFYPVTLEDLRLAERRQDRSRLETLQALRAERFTLMEQLAQLPLDMVFFTQITMEAAEDPEFLDAMRRARVKGALVGVEAVTPEGLKDITRTSTNLERRSSIGCERSISTASTCSAPSSSGCRATAPRHSMRRSRWPNARASPSRSSSCSRRSRARSTSPSGKRRWRRIPRGSAVFP